MPTNDFKALAAAGGANVLTQAEFNALAATLIANGFTSGVVDSKAFNKALRQSSGMAQILGDYIVAKTGLDALDDGNLATLLARFTSAVDLASAGKLIGVQVFTANGTYTPSADMKTCVVEVQGGGGGGAGTATVGAGTSSTGGGGASGSYGKSRLTKAQVGASVAVTVGNGGNGGTVGGGSGQTGGTSSFGAFISASGGGGGSCSTATPPYTAAPGGVAAATGGNILNTSGTPGTPGISTAANGYGGAGAGSPICNGGGGASPNFSSGGGAAAIGYGGGGGGAATGSSQGGNAGGAGKAGLVIVWEYA